MAANNFLADLTPEQKAKATFDVKDAERENWHYIPRARKGLTFKELTPSQRLLAQEPSSPSGLSNRGYEKAVTIMSLDEVLAALEQGKKGPLRDPENYFISIFGVPGGAEPWGWRVEGHHLSLNYTASGDDAPSMTPSFFGANPGEVRTGPRAGTRVLAAEEDLGRALVKSLDPEQLKQALIMETPPKVIMDVPGRNDTTAMGLPQSKMKPDQHGDAREIDQGISLPLPAGCGRGRLGENRESRLRQDLLRLGRRPRPRPAALLSGARRPLRSRVRQHPKRRQSRPQRLARFRPRFRRRFAQGPLRGRAHGES